MDAAAQSALNAAWVQTGAAIAQAIAAALALWASYRLAKRSHDDAKERDAAQDARQKRQQEDAAWALIFFLKSESEELHSAVSHLDEMRVKETKAGLEIFTERAAAASIERLNASASWNFLHAVRAASFCSTRLSDPTGFIGSAAAGDIKSLCMEISHHFDAYLAAIDRDPIRELTGVSRSVMPVLAEPAADS